MHCTRSDLLSASHAWRTYQLPPLKLYKCSQVFSQTTKRKEPRVVLVYDATRPLNMSPEAVALRSYLQTESVELLGSQGTTQQTLEDVGPFVESCIPSRRHLPTTPAGEQLFVGAGDSQDSRPCAAKKRHCPHKCSSCLSGCMRMCSSARYFCRAPLQHIWTVSFRRGEQRALDVQPQPISQSQQNRR